VTVTDVVGVTTAAPAGTLAAAQPNAIKRAALLRAGTK
jgi:hypothetical protein